MKVKEIMTSDVIYAQPSMSLATTARLMRENDVGCLPVRGDTTDIVGIITDRDIAVRAVADGLAPADTHVDQIMTKKVICCAEEEDVEDAVRLMEELQVRRLPVRDVNYQPTGILALADISRTSSQELTGEIVREISKQGQHELARFEA